MPINTNELTAQQQITAVYIAYYDRAPDPAGLQFWVNQLEGGRSLAQIASDFSSAAETIEKYPYFDAPELASADAFITSIYVNLFGRNPDQAGLDFWSDQLESGSTPVGEIILAILEGAQDEATGTFPDSETITNKIDVGLDWTVAAANAGIGTNSNLIAADVDGELVVYNQSAFDSATSILDGVTGDAQSVEDAKAETDNFFGGAANEGDTFVLTDGIDALEGTQDNDTFIANNATFNVGDDVDGSAGIDTLSLANENEDLTLGGRTITDIENLWILNVDPDMGSQDFNISNKMLDKVTVDFAGTDHLNTLYLDNMRADTDLEITDAIANNDTVYRNDDTIYSTLTGSVSQNNTFSNINTVQEDDYIDFENYAYFSNATELNLSLTLKDFVTGDGSGEAGSYYDYVDLDADNATINLEYNVSNMVFENDYTYIYTDIDDNADDATADTVNAVYNVDNVDGLEVDLYTGDTEADNGKRDSVTWNLNGLMNTDDSNYFYAEGIEDVTVNVTGDSEFYDFGVYSSVDDDAVQVINIVADANFMVDPDSGSFDVHDDGAAEMTITGSGDVTFDLNGDNEGFDLDASTATGNLDIEVGTNTGSDQEMSVVAGSGDDIIGTQDALDVDTGGTFSLYSFDGGDGFDTFEIDATDAVTSETNLAAASLAVTDSISNFEALSLTNFGADVVDATVWGLADNVTLADGYGTGGSLTVNSGATVTLAEGTNTDVSLIVDGAGDAGSDDDSLTVNLESEDGDDYSDVTIADVETVSIVSSEIDSDDTIDTNTMDLIAAGATTLNISGTSALDLAQANTDLTAVEMVDASGFDAGLTIDLTTSGEAVTVTTGAGADVVTGSAQADTISVGNGGNTVTGGGEADDITLGSGDTAADVDTIVYTAVSDSQGTTVDTITGFQVDVQATTDTDMDGDVDADDIINDMIDLSAVSVGAGSYLGEAGGYGQVLTSLTGGGATEAVLDTSTSTLYVDVDGNGALDNADMAIDLTGVTELSADNFAF